MSLLSVTLAQYAPALSAVDNLELMEAPLEKAAAAGSDMVVFPEYAHAFSLGLGKEWAATAESESGKFVTGLTSLSERHGGIVVVAGMLMRTEGDATPANTMVAVGPEGILARAEKIHLYDAFGGTESTWIRPGSREEPEVFRCGGMTIGMMACYDLRFPEVARRLVDVGAEVIVTPAQWVPGENKAHHLETLLMARAIETQSFVVACDHPHPAGVGLSQVVDPRGLVIARAGESPDVLHATLDRDILLEVRQANPMAQGRRFGVIPL